MSFIVLTFIAAFLIEGLGTVVSVIGLSALFGSNPIIIALAIALDLGKLIVVAMLYKYWGTLNKMMKIYGSIAAMVTMIITSAGASGYLSGEFQKAISGTQEVSLKVDLLKDEQGRLQKRKEQIDALIAAIPANFTAAQRVRTIAQFRTEQATVTARLSAIDRELPELKVTQIGVEAKAGPILYVAKAFDITVEEAVKWVILMIIFVFDPLAVFLIVAGNFLLDRRKQDKLLEGFDKEKHSGEFPAPLVQNHNAKTFNEEVDVKDDNLTPVVHVRPTPPPSRIITESGKDVTSKYVQPILAPITAVSSVIPQKVHAPEAAEQHVETMPESLPAIASEAVPEAAMESVFRPGQYESVFEPAIAPSSDEQKLPMIFKAKSEKDSEIQREEITYSTLTGIKPDNSVQIAGSNATSFEVGVGTGAFTTGVKPK